MRRWTLGLTLIPLLLGGTIYWHFWSGYRDVLRTDIARLVPGATVTIGGFPYRMEATVVAPSIAHRGVASLSVRAESAIVNRGPWQRDLTVVRTDRPVVDLAAPPAGASAHVAATSAISSVHVVDGRLVRQSNVFNEATATLGLFAAPIAATSLEIHLRELPPRSNEAWSPTPPAQAQVVLAGTGVRIGQGAPLTLAADLAVTGVGRLRDYAGWADGGTVELHELTLADKTGEVVRIKASAIAVDGRMRLAGTITTVCPASVAALFSGAQAPAEERARMPVTLAFGGTAGAYRLDPLPATTMPRAVRAQLPPCPRLG